MTVLTLRPVLAVVACTLLATAAAAQAPASGPVATDAARVESVTTLRGRLIVKMKSTVRTRSGLLGARVASVLRGVDVHTLRTPFPDYASGTGVVDRHGLGRVIEVGYSGDADPAALARLVAATGEVEYAEPIRGRRVLRQPSDTAYARQYALQRIDAEGAWEITKGDSTVVIAIVDTGVDLLHPDLAANIWTNPGEIPGNGIDDDENGKIDDLHGWDFVGAITMKEALEGVFREDADPQVFRDIEAEDIRHHGTHVAGIAGAVTDNVTGVAGVAPNCRIMAVKCASDSFGDQIFRGYEGIVYAARSGADVINCSWGSSTRMQIEADAVAEATALGALVVAAAGNSGEDNDRFDSYPANIDGVLSVGASDSQDAAADFSCYGTIVSVFAPGVAVLSTISGGEYRDGSGTSMASPVVAGVAALVRSVHRDWTPERVASQIRSTCDLMGDGSARTRAIGRVNARRAVEANLNTSAPQVPGLQVTRIVAVGGNDTIRGLDPVRYRLTLRNNLGAAGNLTVNLASADDETEVRSGASHVRDSVATGATFDIEITLAPTPQQRWFSGLAAVRIAYEADDYSDFAMLQLPFHHPSPQRYTDFGQTVGLDFYPFDISAPTMDVAWITGWMPGAGDRIVRLLNDVPTWVDIDDAWLPEVHGIDSMNCVAVGSMALRVTTDGGRTWTPRSTVDAILPIDQLFVFDSTTWAAVGPEVSGTIPLARTTDAGVTWTSDTIRLTQSDPTWMPSRRAMRGSSAWVSVAGDVIRSTDRGRTWSSVTVSDSLAVVNMAFTSELNGLAFLYAQSGSRVAVTTDGGTTWTDRGPIEPSLAYAFLGAPSSDGYTVLGRDGAVIRGDDGRTWTMIPARKLRTSIEGAAFVANDTLLRIWHVGSLIGHLDVPLSTSAVPIELPERGAPTISLFPNPARDRATLDLSAFPDARTVNVHDMTGRIVATHALTAPRGSLDLSNLAPGAYIIVVTGPTSTAATTCVITGRK